MRERPKHDLGDAVVFITAKFCNACRRLEPHFARLEKTAGDDSPRYLRVDATTDRAFAEKNGVNSTPTFLIYKNGRVVATVGTNSPTVMKREIATVFPP